MFKIAFAMIAFVAAVSAQEVVLEDLDQCCEEAAVESADAAVLEEDSEEIVFLDDDLVSEVSEEDAVSSEAN